MFCCCLALLCCLCCLCCLVALLLCVACALRQALALCSRMECTITQSSPCQKPNDLNPLSAITGAEHSQQQIHNAVVGQRVCGMQPPVKRNGSSSTQARAHRHAVSCMAQEVETKHQTHWFALRVSCAVCVSPSSSARARLFCCLCSHPLHALSSPSPILAHALLRITSTLGVEPVYQQVNKKRNTKQKSSSNQDKQAQGNEEHCSGDCACPLGPLVTAIACTQ